MELNREAAAKVLATVDAGLTKGLGSPTPGMMCVEAAVCYALGLPHGDNPECVSRVVGSLKISLNDRNWSSNEARAKGMRRLAIAQLGTAGKIDDREFAKRAAEVAIRKMVPIALRAAASIQKNATHRDALIVAANRCETEGTRDSALAAKTATAAAYAADAADAAAYAAYAAAAAAYAAYAAAASAASAAAAAAASAAAAAADAAYRDKILSDFAEEIVQVLIAMKSPGCEWLDLTEK